MPSDESVEIISLRRQLIQTQRRLLEAQLVILRYQEAELPAELAEQKG